MMTTSRINVGTAPWWVPRKEISGRDRSLLRGEIDMSPTCMRFAMTGARLRVMVVPGENSVLPIVQRLAVGRRGEDSS